MLPCCRLLAVAAAVAVYALVAYIVAFTIELWWLIEAEVTLPLPAYVLCCGYFLIFISSVSLLHGLNKKQSRFLITWLFTLTIFSFPEAGLVLFLSLYYWQLKSLNGMTELVFWGCRCVCNVFGLICIHCLFSAWKEEKLLMRRLQSLHMTQSTLSPQQVQDMSNTKNGSGLQNIAFVNSISPPLQSNKLKRSLSTSHLSVGQVPTIPLAMPNSSSSEFDASTFNGRMLVARSLVDLSQIGDQKTAWSPYATQSLDRRLFHRTGSQSDLKAHVLLRSPSNRYRNQANSSKPSLTESDDLYKYRDIAL